MNFIFNFKLNCYKRTILYKINIFYIPKALSLVLLSAFVYSISSVNSLVFFLWGLKYDLFKTKIIITITPIPKIPIIIQYVKLGLFLLLLVCVLS